MILPRLLAVAVALAAAIFPEVAAAQPSDGSAVPPLAILAERASRRFPQPVRVGDLRGRKLLGPQESQPMLGRVTGLVRRPDGGASVVVRLATWFWEGDRSVAIPVEAIGLLGEHVALLDVTSAQLQGLPDIGSEAGAVVAADDTIRVALAKPFH